ncbi:MAG: asparagine synthase (glutamine-hydrolyzing) [Ekhidna sp.]|nr:asparagine synthase (glutamine-hydrolyzing) [Ekhidna sp.]
MCGIAGYISKKAVSDAYLRRMIDSLRYRGPDGSGLYKKDDEEYQIGLAHRRLSIIDLSNASSQPMQFEHLVLSFNGEIYNFKEIRNELIHQGYTFNSSGDTEVLLKSFHYWGIDAVGKFIGMFAIALWDEAEETLFLYRDRLGIKPLYYYINDQCLVFGSELKPLMLYPYFQKRINSSVLSSYLVNGYIPAPETIFENTRKLRPGCFLRYQIGELSEHVYWSVKKSFEDKNLENNNFEICKNELKNLLRSSVGYRMISDVPLGTFLSGGYDSSLITAVAQELSDIKINTFSIGFNEASYNEANFAKDIANHLGTVHNELYISVDQCKNLLEDLPLYYDEPFADSSMLPTMIVSKLAKDKVTVALTGDGGDELFCGYNSYLQDLKYQRLKPICRVLSRFNSIIPIEFFLSQIGRKYVKLANMDSDDSIINIHNIYSRYYLNEIIKDMPYSFSDSFNRNIALSRNIQEKHILMDMVTYLPDDILTKVDRASMSVSLEARVPLLDHRIVDFSLSIPHHYKFRNGVGKFILKEIAHDYIPKSIMDRPKKGFGIPIYQWIHKDLYYLIEHFLSEEYLKKQGMFNEASVTKLLKNFNRENNEGYFGKIVWHLLVFQMWYDRYFESD